MYNLLTYFKSKLFATAACFFIVIITISCHQYKKNSTHNDVPDDSIARGEELAAIYCASCHMLPDPSVLNTSSWEKGVLPSMGPRLGIFFDGFREYPSFKGDKYVDPNFYPSLPVITNAQWHDIINYYTALAPDTIVAGVKDEPITVGFPLFKAVFPNFKDEIPRTCMVLIDTVLQPGTLLIGDVSRNGVIRFNSQLTPIDSFSTRGPVVDMDLNKNGGIASDIGIIGPNNGKHGALNSFSVNGFNKMVYDTSHIAYNLARPVQSIATDFNKDGKEDYLVCEYGNLKGALSWMENKGDKKYERHVIREVPGAIKAYIQDYNKDGLPDIYVLFAQGDESIFLYTNKGNGKFDENRLLRFPPYNGSSYFELADFNKDGFPDIVYTCGDNADYSAVLKPYHGVYVYLNNGANSFTQQYFFHINGCFKALARDFDNDGDLDIATISFFADYKNRPEEGFVYLQNNGNLTFKPFSVPETQSGRWLTMNAGDIDGDGKIDLVLGNFSAPLMIKSKLDFQKGPAFMVLKNMGR